MAEISKASIFGKLDPLAYRALESAAVFCKLRGNPHVELVHWIHQILEMQDSDLHALIRQYELNPGRLSADIAASLDKLPRGSTSVLSFSPHIEAVMKEAYLYATLLYNQSVIRTGHLVVGLLKTPSLISMFRSISREFEKLKPEKVSDELTEVTQSSAEQGSASSDTATDGSTPGETSGAVPPAAMGKKEALNRFTDDLTAKAKDGKLDPVLGRDPEIRQIIDILMRRRQNNPILTGEAGVGKTAVVEGFALRIAAGEVPPALREVSVRTLDLGLLQAGASMKGEFEQRLRQVIEEVQSSPTPIILFIDEAHTLIGAGGNAGTGDAANLLKPALARGTLRTIAATTWAEYKKYFEKDPALTRRFQVVKVEEPSEETGILMLRGIAAKLAAHHRVLLLDEALQAAVRLSHRYIPARQLPDKAVSLLDTACARVATSQHAVPAEVEDCRHAIAALETETELLSRELALGSDHAEQLAEVKSSIATQRDRLGSLQSRWDSEQALVMQILELRGELAGGAENGDSKQDNGSSVHDSKANGSAEVALPELRRLQAELAVIQGEHPLILPSVDEQAIASVVADWTGIPVGRMVKNEIAAVLGLADTLEKRVIGQRHALEAIAKRVQTSRAGLDNPTRPVGVFLLAGPSGVGKTETALALGETLYGGEQNLVTINMSEFQEAHTVSTLKGSPPGYVGYGEGGILTEAVRRRPYSVVLLDEVEKAHPDVHEVFFQVFDKGQMEDGEGRMIDFKNTLILLTSNVGSELISNLCKDPELMPEPEGIAKALREPLLKVFPAALLGRLVVVPYHPISDEMLRSIIVLQLKRVQKRMADTHGVPLTYEPAVVDLIASRCTETQSGARAVDAIITHTILPEISKTFLEHLANGRSLTGVRISPAPKGQFEYRLA